jgi:competence protein ComEC
VAFFFGALRPAGIVAGLAAVPLSALFMALSAAGLVLSFIPPAVALFAFLLRALGAIITLIVSAAASLPGIKAPPVPALAASILIGAAVFAADRRVKSRRNLAAFE